MKKVSAVVIGAGGRGNTYAGYSILHPDELQIVAVAEPNTERRSRFASQYGIDESMCFESWEALLEEPLLADAAIICTQDNMHFNPAVKSLEKGYHVLLEKPMTVTSEECILLGELSKKYEKTLSICHVLRYTRFFTKLKELLDSGCIGRLISIQHNENVGYWHQAHSYVRGNWRNSNESSPMILAKSCHDMDIMLWLAGADCTSISSFGGLTYFKKENAPVGAPQRCTDGCPVESECPYSAIKLYLWESKNKDNKEWYTCLRSIIWNDLTHEGIEKELKEGPYGRCVFHCDNNVVDHQVVNIEFANEVTAAFTMCAFNKGGRTIKLMGTKGEIRGHFENNSIEINYFSDDTTEAIELEHQEHGHGGGDYGIMHAFVRQLQDPERNVSRTPAHISVQSHLMAFAAEESRLKKQVVSLKQYVESLNVR